MGNLAMLSDAIAHGAKVNEPDTEDESKCALHKAVHSVSNHS